MSISYSETFQELRTKLRYIIINSFSDHSDGYVQKAYQQELFELKWLVDEAYKRLNPEWKREWEKELVAKKLTETK